MGFVRTPADTEAITALLAAPRFGPGSQVAVEFSTDPSVYASLLPSPLVPAAEPIAIASIGRWCSNVVGAYTGGSISLLARLGDVEAAFPVGMWMDSEPAVHFGREIYGEPKKLASAVLDHDDGCVTGTLSRLGTDLVTIRARLDDHKPPGTHVRRTFNVRARTRPDGMGLVGDAELTLTEFTVTTTSHLVGTASLELQSGLQDPAGEIPVLEVHRSSWQEHSMTAQSRVIATIPARTFWPWHLGRLDDPRLLPGRTTGGPT